MGLGYSIKIVGADELQKKLSDGKFTKDPLSDTIKKVTLTLERFVKMATPVDTGRLRSSIKSQVAPFKGIVGTNVEYAPFVEYGSTFAAQGKTLSGRHVEGDGDARVFGEGYFAYGLRQLYEKVPELLKELGHAIEVKWGK